MTNYITKDQIRKGDTIKVTFEESGGVSVVYTGTAREKDFEGDWMSYDYRYLTYYEDDLVDTIELLERPLPTEPGSVFRATEIRGEECDVTVLVGEPYPGEDSARYLSSHFISASATHRPHHITAWEPLDD